MRSLKGQRLQKLENGYGNRGISAVVKWISDNRASFRGPVYGPLITEVTDFTSPEHAAMLEQSVSSASALRHLR